jgi:hypothetical protein
LRDSITTRPGSRKRILVVLAHGLRVGSVAVVSRGAYGFDSEAAIEKV